MEKLHNKDIIPNLLVDLDSLMDTRLPYLSSLSTKVAKEVIDNGYYTNRLKDQFNTIPYDLFTPIYRNRSKLALKLATPTNMLAFIGSYITEALLETKSSGVSKKIKLYINTYPYTLSTIENNHIVMGIRRAIAYDIDIEAVYMSFDDLTPKWVDANLAAMIMYNGIDWLEYHSAYGLLKEHKLSTTALFVPTLTYSNSTLPFKTPKELEEFFTTIEETYSPIIKLKFMSTTAFSSVLCNKD